MKEIFMVCVFVVLVSSCGLIGPPIEIDISYGVQLDGIVDLEFPILFPSAADIDALQLAVDLDAEIASHGPTLGATIAVVSVTSSQKFYITGVRIEDIRYRLSPSGPNPIGTTSDIAYIHPVFGEISPILANLGLPAESESAVIEIPEDAAQTIEVGLASALSMWNTIDADRDGIDFPDDDDEVIDITCSLFFEGFLEWGIEFSGSFPPPIRLNIVVKHDV